MIPEPTDKDEWNLVLQTIDYLNKVNGAVYQDDNIEEKIIDSKTGIWFNNIRIPDKLYKIYSGTCTSMAMNVA